jgi:hypothetical protein
MVESCRRISLGVFETEPLENASANAALQRCSACDTRRLRCATALS